jgi:zinc transporter 1/2/3
VGSSYALARYHGRGGLAGTSGVLPAVIVFVKGLSCGVVLSVALVHLISEAYELFEGVPGWDTFQPWPMVFTMVGIYSMAVIETIANRTYATDTHIHTHTHAPSSGDRNTPPNTPMPTGSMEHITSKQEIDVIKTRRLHITAFVIEAGILFHSLIIGFDLGLQSQDQWGPVCAAIAAHQFLEGLMMGQVLGDMRNASGNEYRAKVWCMMLFFTITVSIGVCIGIIVHTSVSSENQAALDITVAILNCLAGGFLLYLAIASLLVPWFVSSTALRDASQLYAALAYAGLAVGIASMTAIALME